MNVIEINRSKAICFSAALAICVLFVKCGGSKSNDPTPSPQELIKTKLVAKWNLQSASVDGIDQTSVYKNLVITFSATGYSSLNGGLIWPTSGTWVLNDGKSIKRNDGLIVDIEVSDSNLTLTFDWTKTAFGSGRVQSIKGKHVLKLTK